MEPASRVIEGKLRFGLLPSADPVKTWLGRGGGTYCDGCDTRLSAGAGEVELQFADGETLRLHDTCVEIWAALKGNLVDDAAEDLSRLDTLIASRPAPLESRQLPSSS